MRNKRTFGSMSLLFVLILAVPLAGCGGGEDSGKCEGITCSNHGTCNEDTGACVCDAAYVGSDCESCATGFQDNDQNGTCMPDCASSSLNCGAHGSCVDSSGVALCVCADGYAGADCGACAAGYQDNDANGSCTPDCSTAGLNCGDNQACTDASGTATCACMAGYQDNDGNGTCLADCSTAGLNCVHGACDDGSGTAYCACETGWGGTDCSTCAAGYHPDGDTCVADTDCQANTCGGHGTCDDTSGNPVCTCDAAYTGDHCELCAAGYQDNDHNDTCTADCATAALNCNAHAHCDDSTGTALCACNAGYTNPPDCDTCAAGYQDNDSNGECLPDCPTSGLACGDHGTCSDASGVPLCVCDTEYAGEFCDMCAAGYQDYDNNGVCLPDCGTAALNCNMHGNCDDSTGVAHCNCYEGYEGEFCDSCTAGYQDNDDNGSCLPDCTTAAIDCGANGSCSDLSGAAECECNTGYAGDVCDECAAGYQDNDSNGTCVEGCAIWPTDCGTYGACNDSSGFPTCVCVEGYQGPTCEDCAAGYQDNDDNGTCHPDCATAQPACVHGHCEDDTGQAVCVCDTGYAGTLCENCQNGYQDNDGNGTCEPNCATSGLSCGAHGHCEDTSGTAGCYCDEGYTGADCDQCDTGYQDSDGNGTCRPDCDTTGYTVSCAEGGHGYCDYAGGVAVCVCDTGYIPDGNGHCTNSGTGEDCASPLPLDLNAGTVSGDTMGSGNEYAPTNCGYSPAAEEVVYTFTTSEVVTVKFTTDGQYDSIIYMRTVCDDPDSEIACNDDGGPAYGSEIELVDLQPGTYYLFIDGYNANSGPYVLTIELSCTTDQLWDPDSGTCVDNPCLVPSNPCTDPHMTVCEPVLPDSYNCYCDPGYIDDPDNPGTCIPDPNPHGETCADAMPLEVVGTGQVTGTTTDAAHDMLSGPCSYSPRGNGPDRVYYFTLSEAMRAEFEMTGYDTVLYLFTVCDDADSQVACDDDSGAGSGSLIGPLFLDPGTYYLWADSYNNPGDYVIDYSFRVDPCADEEAMCPGTPVCVSSADWSSYECVCPDGTLPWQGDCVDNPCEDPNPCTDPNKNVCTPDLPASFICTCNLGYIDDPDNPGTCIEDPDANEWAFIVYLNADNNLDPAGHDDVYEMGVAGSTAYVHIIALFDTAGYSDDGHARKIYVTQGGYDVVEDMNEIDMGDWQTMRDYGIWAMQNYPARHYAFIMWDHGSGWDKEKPETGLFKGFSYDDSSGNNISVAGGDYAQALAGITAALGGKIDIVGHDECLMGMWEVGAASAPYAHYMVASEDNEPFDGWAYDGFLPDLIADPLGTTALMLATNIVDAYYAAQSSNATQSVMNLDSFGDLDVAMTGFANAMMNNPSYYNQIETARSNSESFSYGEFRDLKDFATRVTNISGVPADLLAAANALIAQLDISIAYNMAQSGYPGANGMTVYFPSQSSSVDSAYMGAGAVWSQNTTWDDFLLDFTGSK